MVFFSAEMIYSSLLKCKPRNVKLFKRVRIILNRSATRCAQMRSLNHSALAAERAVVVVVITHSSAVVTRMRFSSQYVAVLV